MDHITELRKRLLWSFIYIIIIFIICFYFAGTLFAFLAKPLVRLLDTDNGQGFIYTALQEAFFTELRIAFFFALFFCISINSDSNMEIYRTWTCIQMKKELFSLF